MAYVTQIDPNYEARPTEVEIGFRITNDDSGATYNSGSRVPKIFGDIANTSTKTAVISALAIATSKLAEAGYVVQLDPIQGSLGVDLNFSITNDNPGAIYNSGGILSDIFGDLATQLYGLEANQNAYGNIEELMGAWSFNITSSGNVYNGWNNTLNSEGGVSLSNNGGWAGFDYDQWSSETGSNTMALTLRIPLSQLELDGITGYNPQTDARIELSDTVVNNAFVGVMNDLNHYPAPMQQYQVVPEPMTALMFGLGALGVMVRRAGKKLFAN